MAMHNRDINDNEKHNDVNIDGIDASLLSLLFLSVRNYNFALYILAMILVLSAVSPFIP